MSLLARHSQSLHTPSGTPRIVLNIYIYRLNQRAFVQFARATLSFANDYIR